MIPLKYAIQDALELPKKMFLNQDISISGW